MKKLLCVFLSLLLLAGMVVAPVPAQAVGETDATATTGLCSCGCGLSLDAVQWTPWDPNVKGKPVNGHYYLVGDYAQNTQYQVDSGVRAVLDLRGHKLTTADNRRLFLVYGYLEVIDTVGGGRLCSRSTGTANGGMIMIGWDAVAMNDEMDATVILRNCTATLDEGNNGGSEGGLFSVGGNCTLKAYSTRFINARANKRGGAVYAGSTTSTVEMKDCSVIGCSAASNGGAIFSGGKLTLDNCKLIGNTSDASGGAIYGNSGTITMKNSMVASGSASSTAYGGGNIATTGSCTVNISDSTVRNGYALKNGGNLLLGKGTHTLKNVTVEGGVTGGKGANLYVTDANAVTTLENCKIFGDVHYENGKLTLKGATDIAVNSTGLRTVSATVNESALTGTVIKAETGVCPHCDQQVTWSALSGTPSGHCYLTANVTLTEAYTIAADTIVDLRGYKIISSDRAFTVTAEGALTLLDSVGGGTVTGSGNADGMGGVIQNAGDLRIYGGNYVYVADAQKPVKNGGVVYAGGDVWIHGGFFDGSAYNNTASNSRGGTLYQADKAGSFTLSAGRFVGGSAYTGGTMLIGGNNTVNITGGSVIGGSAAKNAGNLAIAGTSTIKNGTAEISGLYIAGGTSVADGGNFAIYYYKPSQMRNCYIGGGSTEAGRGGNLYATSNTLLTMTDCVISQGSAAKGGNIFSTSYVADVTLVDCLVTDGEATTADGGNINCANGTIVLKGGEVAYGKAATTGGNISNATGGNQEDDIVKLQADSAGKAPILAGGTAGTYGGNIYSKGKLNLDAATFVNGMAASGGTDLCMGKASASHLTVGAGVSGKISVFMNAAYLGDTLYGSAVANTAATTLNAELVLENDELNPCLCVKDGQLYVGAATVKKTAGNEAWYADPTAAVAACPADGWVKLYADAQLTLQKDCCVDLGGKTLRVSGAGTLYGMDSSGDAYTVGTGKAQWTSEDAVKTAPLTDAPNGKRYVAVTDGTSVTYHRLGMELTNVTIRTSQCGIYYKGTWGGDSVLTEMIDEYGVTVSLKGMPGANFAGDSECLYAHYDGDSLVTGQTQTGVLIKNIMKDGVLALNNQRRGEMPIFAAAYVKMKDGTVYISDRAGSEDDIAYSLRSAMERMDQLIISQPTLYLRDDVAVVREFYETWKNKGMQNWSFQKLKMPEDDGVLKIIILGSSRSVNTFHLLYEVFKDQMPDQELVLGVMYYSGCSMTMHKKFIQNNQPVYQYYCNNNGRWTITPGMYMHDGLHAENWDVVLLQAGSGDLDKQMQKDVRIFLKDYIDDHLIDPYELWWHSTWFNSTDPDLYKPPKTAEEAAAVDQRAQLTSTNQAAKDYVLNDPMFDGHIASGTAMMYALRHKGVTEKALFRDHTHIHDLGCLLVGYSWYAQFTGKPVTEININTIPVYLRHKDDQAGGDFQVTQEMKDMIMESVAYTMADPWSVPWVD